MRRQYFGNLPIFAWDTNILEIHLYFHETPVYWKSAYIFMRHQYFGISPTFCKSANNLWIFLVFVTANIYVYFQYLFMHLSMCQYFWHNCFNLRFKIDVVVMIIRSIVIIINFVLPQSGSVPNTTDAALDCKNDLVSSQNAVSTKGLIIIRFLKVLANLARRFPVLLLWDVSSGSQIPDPRSWIQIFSISDPWSRILDPRSSSKNLSILTQNNGF